MVREILANRLISLDFKSKDIKLLSKLVNSSQFAKSANIFPCRHNCATIQYILKIHMSISKCIDYISQGHRRHYKRLGAYNLTDEVLKHWMIIE